MRPVLVVEDDVDIRETLVDALEDSGFAAVSAANGRDALDILRTQKPRPCVILLDLMMPEMDGRAFREAQRQMQDVADIPVIVLSAYRDVESNIEGMDVAAHVRKPPDLAELLRLVNACSGSH